MIQELERKMQVLLNRMRVRTARYTANGAHAESYEKANTRDKAAVDALRRQIALLSSGVSTEESRNITRRMLQRQERQEAQREAQRERQAHHDAMFFKK